MKKILTILITLILSICLINVNTNKTSAEDGELILENYPIPVMYLRVSGAKAHLEFEISPPSVGTEVEYVTSGGSGPLLSVSTSDHLKFEVNCTGAGIGYKIARFQVIGRSDVYKELLVLAENDPKVHVFGDYEQGSQTTYYVVYNGKIENFMKADGSGPDSGCSLKIQNIVSNDGPTTLTYGTNYTVMAGDPGDCVIFQVDSTFMESLQEGKYEFIVDAKNSETNIHSTETTAVVDNRAIPSSNPDLSKGEMVFDKNKLAGYGAFVGTRTEKHAELPAVAKIMKIAAPTVDVYHLDENYEWQLLGSGYRVERYNPPASNADKYTRVILEKEYLNYISKGRNILRIDMSDGTQSVSYYVDLNINEYVDPTPVDPTYESCEKVIGPSWHWNESKGICEDYGVVGTYTR